MLKLTDSPFNLVRFHLSQDLVEYKNTTIIRTDDLQILRDTLLESISYNEEGLLPSIYLIYYTGTKVPDDFKQSSYNTTYLVVDKISKWKHFKSKSFKERVQFFSVKPTQYAHLINVLSSCMNKQTFAYFWSEYCIGKFNSNPYKWYNESKYLMYLYKDRNKLFTIEDLDCLYNKVSDVVKPYLRNIFTPEGIKYIRQMTSNEKFVIFIGTPRKKALIESYITRLCPEVLEAYMYFKQSFYDGKIRMDEGVVILDHILNKEKDKLSTKELKNLFGLN